MSCIFCKIAAGDIPALVFHADADVLAFLDIAPINKGHLLVIPRAHHPSPATIPVDVCGRMLHLASRMGVALKRALDADGFNLHLSDGACAGQVVMHAHIHVVPRFPGDGFHWNWRQLRYESDAERQAIFDSIKSRMRLDA